MDIKPVIKNPSLISHDRFEWPLHQQLGKESNSLEIGSQEGRVNTHCAMDKQNLSKIPMAN